MEKTREISDEMIKKEYSIGACGIVDAYTRLHGVMSRIQNSS
jgi:hypothetical protein